MTDVQRELPTARDRSRTRARPKRSIIHLTPPSSPASSGTLPVTPHSSVESCGSILRGVVIKDKKDQNHALDRDFAFVELRPKEEEDGKRGKEKRREAKEITVADSMKYLALANNAN